MVSILPNDIALKQQLAWYWRIICDLWWEKLQAYPYFDPEIWYTWWENVITGKLSVSCSLSNKVLFRVMSCGNLDVLLMSIVSGHILKELIYSLWVFVTKHRCILLASKATSINGKKCVAREDASIISAQNIAANMAKKVAIVANKLLATEERTVEIGQEKRWKR